jgi:Zn-dependent peptidase ImmA (M78 family)
MRARAQVRLEWLKEIIDYLSEFFDFPSLDVPRIDIADINVANLDYLEEVASQIRAEWNIGEGPFPDAIEKLETHGILVSRIHVGVEKLDAFSQWSNRFEAPFIVLSRDKASACRQRYDALHELAHIVLHRSVKAKRLNDRASYKLVEKQADMLTGCLLLPEREFVEELYAPSLDGFLALKERWGVSVGAMIMRCVMLDLIDDDQARRMFINYNRRGWRKGEPLDGKMEKERPQIIRRSFEMLLDEKVQSVSQIKAALPFPADDLEELTDLDPGTLTAAASQPTQPKLKPEYRDGGNSKVVSIFDHKRG